MAASTPRIDSLDQASISSPSTNITLTNTSASRQILTPTASIDVNLPTANIKTGRVFNIVNAATPSSGFFLTIKSSDTSTVDLIANGYIQLIALVDSPTTPADWYISRLSDTEIKDVSGLAEFTSGTLTMNRTRSTITVSSFDGLVYASPVVTPAGTAGTVPSRFSPATSFVQDVTNASSGGNLMMKVVIQTNGAITPRKTQITDSAGLSVDDTDNFSLSWARDN